MHRRKVARGDLTSGAAKTASGILPAMEPLDHLAGTPATASGAGAGASGGSQHDLGAELEAERANTDHWRRVARERAARVIELERDPVLRALRAAERRARPAVRSIERQAKCSLAKVDHLLLTAAGRLRGRAVARRRLELGTTMRALPAYRPTSASISLVAVTSPRNSRGELPELSNVTERIVLERPEEPAALVRAVRQAMESSTGDLVCLLADSAEPLDESWLERLAAPIRDGVVATTALLVQPARDRNRTPHDLAVREAGLAALGRTR